MTPTPTLTTNQPASPPGCGLIPRPTCRAKSETAHLVPPERN